MNNFFLRKKNIDGNDEDFKDKANGTTCESSNFLAANCINMNTVLLNVQTFKGTAFIWDVFQI